MNTWIVRLRALPLQTKLVITLVGGALALLGVSTHVSFRYWKQEALTVAEQQALLAAGAVRGPVEASLLAGQSVQARRSLRQLVDKGVIESARVFAPDGSILLSSAAVEEGTRDRIRWIPRREALPSDGVVRYEPKSESVEAYLPLAVPGTAVLQVVFPVGPIRMAMDRGLRVGIALVIASVLGMTALLFTMLDREVVKPVQAMSGLFEQESRTGASRTDEIRGLASSVAVLIKRERAADELARTRGQQIAAQAGLAQVGEMAAEMAHEFKRPLASIQTALQLMDQEYALDPRGEQMMDSVRMQLDKLSETMRDLFSLARPVEHAREAVDLREVVDGALMHLSSHPAVRGVELRREYEDTLPVHGDAHRLEQVALNLMLNAAEAMPNGGQLTVRLRTESGAAVLEVADTGVGIPQDAIDKVLRPFYSTKPTGTGLGLSLVARIVAAHGGTLHIESEPGRGTTIWVAFPVVGADQGGGPVEERWLTHAS
jgi:signal transduction histidine kinase